MILQFIQSGMISNAMRIVCGVCTQKQGITNDINGSNHTDEIIKCGYFCGKTRSHARFRALLIALLCGTSFFSAPKCILCAKYDLSFKQESEYSRAMTLQFWQGALSFERRKKKMQSKLALLEPGADVLVWFGFVLHLRGKWQSFQSATYAPCKRSIFSVRLWWAQNDKIY